MKYEGFKLENYKGFEETPFVRLEPQVNLIVGANNSGKTALLEALSLNFPNKPHNSIKRRYGNPLAGVSSLQFEVSLSGEELRQTLMTLPNPSLPIPDEAHYKQWVESVFSREKIVFSMKKSSAEERYVPARYPSHGLFNAGRPRLSVSLHPDIQHDLLMVGQTSATAAGRDVGDQIAQRFSEAVYFFNAERTTLAQSRIGPEKKLSPRAENLAEVISNLQHDRFRYEEFSNLVTGILPNVKQVIAQTIDQHSAVVFVSAYEASADRMDLFVNLSDCGSGVGQVLAISYVLATARDPKTILIDEPNSFLHPGAVKRLIAAIRHYSDRHQFIVSTHSPEVIASSNPKAVVLTTWNGTESQVSASSGPALKVARDALDEVGVRLSDLFGADAVLWVEGGTEERCYPYILRTVCNRELSGVAILGVPATGDFGSRRLPLVLSIYRKLSTSATIMPPVLKFLFDREELSEREIHDIRSQSRGMVSFLPRRCYENYLVHPESIATVLNAEESEVPPLSLLAIENGWRRKVGNPDTLALAPRASTVPQNGSATCEPI